MLLPKGGPHAEAREGIAVYLALWLANRTDDVGHTLLNVTGIELPPEAEAHVDRVRGAIGLRFLPVHVAAKFALDHHIAPPSADDGDPA